jgi:hypothetical protein
MLQVKELKRETDSFLKDFKGPSDKFKEMIKNGTATHFELYKVVNEMISCLNVYKHDIKDLSAYTGDEKDYFNLKEY